MIPLVASQFCTWGLTVVISLSDSMTFTVMLKWFFRKRMKLTSFVIIKAAVRLSVK
jgi:hypothetical protein